MACMVKVIEPRLPAVRNDNAAAGRMIEIFQDDAAVVRSPCRLASSARDFSQRIVLPQDILRIHRIGPCEFDLFRQTEMQDRHAHLAGERRHRRTAQEHRHEKSSLEFKGLWTWRHGAHGTPDAFGGGRHFTWRTPNSRQRIDDCIDGDGERRRGSAFAGRPNAERMGPWKASVVTVRK